MSSEPDDSGRRQAQAGSPSGQPATRLPETEFNRHGPTAANAFKEGSAVIRIRTTCIALLATVVTVLITAPDVLAQITPHDPGGSISIPIPPIPLIPPTAPTAPAAVVSYGSPIWMFVVVALLAALLTTAALLISYKLRHASRSPAAHT
jgi:hypothetical protein